LDSVNVIDVGTAAASQTTASDLDAKAPFILDGESGSMQWFERELGAKCSDTMMVKLSDVRQVLTECKSPYGWLLLHYVKQYTRLRYDVAMDSDIDGGDEIHIDHAKAAFASSVKWVDELRSMTPNLQLTLDCSLPCPAVIKGAAVCPESPVAACQYYNAPSCALHCLMPHPYLGADPSSEPMFQPLIIIMLHAGLRQECTKINKCARVCTSSCKRFAAYGVTRSDHWRCLSFSNVSRITIVIPLSLLSSTTLNWKGGDRQMFSTCIYGAVQMMFGELVVPFDETTSSKRRKAVNPVN